MIRPILLFAALASTAAAVVIDFADGQKETFVSAVVEGGKLKCSSRIGVIQFSPEALGRTSKARYFPELTAAPTTAKNPPPPPTHAGPVPPPEPALAPQAPPTTTTDERKSTSEFVTFEGRLREQRHGSVILPKPLDSAQFFVHVPAGYDGSEPYGLITFIHADDRMELPDGWDRILDERKLIYVAPQKAGNDSPDRLGLAVAGTLAVMRDYKIDPKRSYVAGFSGGARCATMLGYYAADLFPGVIAICGANFHKRVPRKEATKTDDYGHHSASANEARDAKRTVRFAIITGETDWRRGNIVDVFRGGYEDEKFQARLWEVPGLGHSICGAQTLAEAVDFIEGKTP